MYSRFIKAVREIYGTGDFIPLHEPRFAGNERDYAMDCIDSTFVSSVGKYVTEFEQEFAAAVGAKHAVAVVNGTAALQVSLQLAGVEAGHLVLTQPLSFVATCNAIRHCGADPVFLDVDRSTLGLDPAAVAQWLEDNTVTKDGVCTTKDHQRIVSACVPMHTFGNVGDIDGLHQVCSNHGIRIVEDAAEAVGSRGQQQHAGTTGTFGTFSFNGNKIITTGGGGMITTNDGALAKRAKHITTTAKLDHRWLYEHDEVAYNYRMPNLNAALGCAQLEQLDSFVMRKRELHDSYQQVLGDQSLELVAEPAGTRSNYWLNALLLNDAKERDSFLEQTNDAGIMTRPVWSLLHTLPMFKHCDQGPLENAAWLADRLVNIPSSVPMRNQ